MAIEIPDEAEFYVRTAIGRALHFTSDRIKYLRQAADEIDADPEEKRKMFSAEARAAASHEQVWLAETVDALKSLPDGLRPDLVPFRGITRYGPYPTEQMTADRLDTEIAALQLLRDSMGEGGK
jgi:hypothetical protein